MPAVTPNFSIPYPCLGDTIDPTIFADWAEGIDAALVSVSSAAQASRLPPRASASGTTLVGLGLTTNLNIARSIIADSRITHSPTFYTVTQAGVYMLSLQLAGTNSTTVTFSQAIIQGPGTQIITRTFTQTGGVTVPDMNISGLMLLAAGSSVVPQLFWNGTGGPISIGAFLTIALVCEV